MDAIRYFMLHAPHHAVADLKDAADSGGSTHVILQRLPEVSSTYTAYESSRQPSWRTRFPFRVMEDTPLQRNSATASSCHLMARPRECRLWKPGDDRHQTWPADERRRWLLLADKSGLPKSSRSLPPNLKVSMYFPDSIRERPLRADDGRRRDV